MTYSLTGQTVSSTYGRLVQVIGDTYYDGFGNELFSIIGSVSVGPQGDVGPTGPQGPVGDAGSTGIDGSQGSTGPQGSTGIQGVTGSQGVTGPSAAPSLNLPFTLIDNITVTHSSGSYPLVQIIDDLGNNIFPASIIHTSTYSIDINFGATLSGTIIIGGGAGNQGPAGPAGPSGSPGPAGGPQGYQGVTGPQGSVGTQGNTGTQGTTGPQGSGDQGSTGPQGNTGPQGETGPQGSGSQGSTGPQGNTGPQGETGPQGITGVQGFTGPQGNTGFQGFTGPQGFTGYQGVTGPQGFTGDQGTTGAQGETGPQGSGSQGSTGSQGNTGPQGNTGTQGTTGPQGFAGPQGFQGKTGPQGPQGQKGQSNQFFNYLAITSSTVESYVTGSYFVDGYVEPTGYIIWNNPTQISATALSVSHIDESGDDVDIFLELISAGDKIIIQDRNNSDSYQQWLVNGPLNTTPNTYVEIPVSLVTATGLGYTNFPNNHEVILVISSIGATGPQGPQGFQGPTGVQGNTGPQGFQGNQGPTGANGIDGGLEMFFNINEVIGPGKYSLSKTPTSDTTTYLESDILAYNDSFIFNFYTTNFDTIVTTFLSTGIWNYNVYVQTTTAPIEGYFELSVDDGFTSTTIAYSNTYNFGFVATKTLFTLSANITSPIVLTAGNYFLVKFIVTNNGPFTTGKLKLWSYGDSYSNVTTTANIIGDQGFQGPTGIQGNTGPQGPTGSPGTTGPAGDSGTNPDWYFQGTWQAPPSIYAVGDIVTYNGETWYNNSGGPLSATPSVANGWDQLSAKGSTGSQGPTGPQGPAGSGGGGGGSITPTVLIDAATISIDITDSNSSIFSVTLGGNRTLENPTNMPTGTDVKYFGVIVTQDATGSRTLSYDTQYNTGDIDTDLNYTANSRTHLYFMASTGLVELIGKRT